MTAICADLNGYKRMIFVRRQMLLLQTIRVLERELGVPIGQVGAGVINIQDLTVMMIPTVARAVDPKWKFEKLDDDDEDDDTKLTEEQKQQVRDYVSSAQCMIIDECHCLGAETAQIISKFAVGARYRLGFSATDWRDDGKDILLTAATGSRKVDISASYLIERNYLVPPHIYFLQTPKVRLPHFMQGQYQDVYKEFVVENEERNQLIIDKALEAYNRFEKVVILVKQIEHGKIIEKALLDEGAWVDYISGKSTAITREDVIRQFQNRSRSILIGSSILDEGVDIPEISVLINAGGGKSSAKYYQQIGRAIRLAEDKKRAIIIDFIDNDIKFMRNHSKARIKLIKTESLYKLKIQGSMDE
jgi:superfamily II DNA or RNA helicase